MKSVGIPAEAQDVTEEILDKFFPTTAVVTEWAAGRDAAWPPEPEPPTDVVLRFPVGARVEACCGPQQWKPGRVVQHWYVRRAGIPQTGYGDPAAATRIFRGDASRRRRGRDADIPWRRVAATPGAATRIFRGDESRRRRGLRRG